MEASSGSLLRAMNDEQSTTAPIVLHHDQETLTGEQAADHLIDSFENISTYAMPQKTEK